jgi:SAM-dependent methyltransferase
VDSRAANGFSANADDYQRARPSWPREAPEAAFAHWGLDPTGGLVVDVAAGTGRLTSVLAQICPRLLAVEPVENMRAHIRGADAVAGTAEQLPLRDGEAQAIFSGEAFHWFDRPAALAEFARVLSPGGGVAIMWNTAPRLEPLAWQQAVGRLCAALPTNPTQRMPPGINSVVAPYRNPADADWRSGPEWDAFEPVVHREFFHAQALDRPGIVALVSSWSFVGVMEPEARQELLARVEEVLIEHSVETHEQHWRCDMYVTRRR